MTGRSALVRLALDAPGGGEPLVVPQIGIGLGDLRGGAEAFADVRAALGGVGQGADELGVEQIITQGEGHSCSMIAVAVDQG